MACRLYKGVGLGTYLHGTNLKLTGITARNPGVPPSTSAVEQHIARGTITSPLISLTKSFGVARDYAIDGSFHPPTSANPAHVWELDIPDPLPPGVTLIDPVHYIAAAQQLYLLSGSSYHHDGDQRFLQFVVDPRLRAGGHPLAPRPAGMGAPNPVTLTIALETLVFALRDAEVLAVGNVPGSLMIFQHPVY